LVPFEDALQICIVGGVKVERVGGGRLFAHVDVGLRLRSYRVEVGLRFAVKLDALLDLVFVLGRDRHRLDLAHNALNTLLHAAAATRHNRVRGNDLLTQKLGVHW
jgi:hypothetical protein